MCNIGEKSASVGGLSFSATVATSGEQCSMHASRGPTNNTYMLALHFHFVSRKNFKLRMF